MKIQGNSWALRQRTINDFFGFSPLWYLGILKDRRAYLKSKRRWYRDYKWGKNNRITDKGSY